MAYYCSDLSSILFRVIQAGVVIIDIETKMIVDINPAACIMIGTDRESVMGKACHEYLCVNSCEGCPAFVSDADADREVIENKEIKLELGILNGAELIRAYFRHQTCIKKHIPNNPLSYSLVQRSFTIKHGNQNL